MFYLEQPQNVGYHNGDNAERGSYYTCHWLVRHKDWWLAVLAFVFWHVLQQEKNERKFNCVIQINFEREKFV